MTEQLYVQDVTLRNGMHAVRHRMEPADVATIVAALDAAGVDAVEAAHGDGLAGRSLNYGPGSHTDWEWIDAAAGAVDRAVLTTLLLPGTGTIAELEEAFARGVRSIRIATRGRRGGRTRARSPRGSRAPRRAGSGARGSACSGEVFTGEVATPPGTGQPESGQSGTTSWLPGRSPADGAGAGRRLARIGNPDMVYAFTTCIRPTGGVPEVLMAHADVDVAIIGAGPVGMALACELIRHGLTVRIVDKAASTKDYSRAPVFWPRAQEALDLMGIRPLWEGRTVPMRRIHVSLYGQPAGVVAMDGGASAHPTPILAGQDVTEKILDDHLTSLGTPVERATEATAVAVREDGADVTIKPKGGEAETFAASWVVGCEGAPSVVRTSAGIGWEGHQLKGLMVPIADAKAKWPLINKVGDCHVALTDKGYFLTIPLPGVQRIIVAVPDDTPPGEQPETTLDEVAALMADAIGGPVELSDAPWVTVVRYGNFLADRLREGRALLAGDAAHSIAPLSGQGMNTGVQDAFDLGWKLSYVHKGWAPIGLLDSYDADRGPIAKHLARTTDRFFKFVLDPTAAQKHLVKAVGSTALKVRKVRETISEFYTELSVAYPQSPLNDAHAHRAPKPGEHVLDGDLVRWPDLEPLRLYDLLRGLHWTVIAFTGADPRPQKLAATRRRLAMLVNRWDAKRLTASLVVQSPNPSDQGATSEVTTTLDAWGDLHDVYGASSGALLLIRPDGYVALHRDADDAGFAALDDLLGRTLQAAVAT